MASIPAQNCKLKLDTVTRKGREAIGTKHSASAVKVIFFVSSYQLSQRRDFPPAISSQLSQRRGKVQIYNGPNMTSLPSCVVDLNIILSHNIIHEFDKDLLSNFQRLTQKDGVTSKDNARSWVNHSKGLETKGLVSLRRKLGEELNKKLVQFSTRKQCNQLSGQSMRTVLINKGHSAMKHTYSRS